MVMGLEGAQEVLQRHPELMAYLIYDDGHGGHSVWFSPSLKDRIAD
jgi:thiamine biosynthesis lipoprotein